MKININSKKIDQIINAEKVTINQSQVKTDGENPEIQEEINISNDNKIHVKDLVRRNKLEAALDFLSELVGSKTELGNLTIGLKRQFQEIKMAEIKGIIPRDEHTIRISKIADSILQLVS